jgi:ribose-phosphate pyrophosphokinase
MDLQLFAPAGSTGLAGQVASSLGGALSPLEEREFEDTEYKIRPLVSVRGDDVYVLHSLAADRERSVDDKLCRLLFGLGALKDAGAARVTAVIPYLAYGRKDSRTKARDPLTTRYVAQLIEAMGVDRVLALDVHNLAAFENAFRCRAEHLEALPLFVQWIVERLAGQPLVLVSPDIGGVKRVDRLREILEKRLGDSVPVAFMEKRRSGGQVSGKLLVGEVSGRIAVILDDMISSGTTVLRAAQACRAQGAVAVHALATHGLFAGAANSVLTDAALESVVVTDSVSAWRLEPALAAKVTQVQVAPLLAAAVRCLHAEQSLTKLREAASEPGNEWSMPLR